MRCAGSNVYRGRSEEEMRFSMGRCLKKGGRSAEKNLGFDLICLKFIFDEIYLLKGEKNEKFCVLIFF